MRSGQRFRRPTGDTEAWRVIELKFGRNQKE
jgi:hypothetical protein